MAVRESLCPCCILEKQMCSVRAHMAPTLRFCKVKVTGSGCVQACVYPTASGAVAVHTRKCSWACTDPAG